MWAFVPGLMLLAPIIPSEPAEAQTGASAYRVKSQKKAPGRYRAAGQYRGSQAKQQIEARRQQKANRHLVSPMGSAANVRPGFYDQLGGGQVVFNGAILPPYVTHPQPYGYPAQPYVVYVDGNAIEPPIYGQQPPESQVPPIYIVNQQPPPQVIQVPVQPSSPLQPSVPTANAPAPQPVAPQPVVSQRSRPAEPQPLSLSIHPPDAQVYLDDELLGSANAVVSSLSSLDPGIYVLEVLHDNFLPQRLVFGVTEFPVSIAIDLSSDRPGGRARVK